MRYEDLVAAAFLHIPLRSRLGHKVYIRIRNFGEPFNTQLLLYPFERIDKGKGDYHTYNDKGLVVYGAKSGSDLIGYWNDNERGIKDSRSSGHTSTH